MARQVTIFMKLTASFNIFKRGWDGPEMGLTTSLHLNAIFCVQLGLTLCAPVSIVW